MATAPGKSPNKNRTNPPRLGRGLSSLIGGPVRVEATPSSDNLSVQTAERPVSDAQAPSVATASPSLADAGEATEGEGRLRYLALDAITPSPYQPRSVASEAGLEDLARSIRESGVMQPVVVRQREGASEHGRYELVAGERRLRASRLAGLGTIPAVVVVIDDRTAAEWALVENIQREDLNAVDRARAFRALAEGFDLTHAQVAERVGLDRATVANSIRLTELEAPILEMLAKSELSAGHGKALLAAAPGEARVALARRVAHEDWSVRALEHHLRAEAGASAVKSGGVAAETAPTTKERSAQIVALEKQLSEHLSSKVRIKARPGANKGRVEIDFYDLDHFDALMERLGFSPE